MLACLACYGPRLAALLESATELRFSHENVSHGCTSETLLLNVPVGDLGLARLLDTLRAAGAELLICGGITSEEREFIADGGIRVEAWVAGTTEEVLQAWRSGWLAAKRMPGCGGTGDSLGSAR